MYSVVADGDCRVHKMIIGQVDLILILSAAPRVGSSYWVWNGVCPLFSVCVWGGGGGGGRGGKEERQGGGGGGWVEGRKGGGAGMVEGEGGAGEGEEGAIIYLLL